MIRAALAAALLALAAAGCGGGGTTTVTVTQTRTVTRTVTAPAGGAAGSACTGADLGGSFADVPGSAGAGQVSYALTLTNTGSATCFVSGLPVVQLLDAKGNALPTHVSAAQPGTQAAARVALAPGASATAQARFSPDVPGPGEQQSGPCELEAATLRVTPTGGGAVDVPIEPPTSVCEQGALRFSLLASAG